MSEWVEKRKGEVLVIVCIKELGGKVTMWQKGEHSSFRSLATIGTKGGKGLVPSRFPQEQMVCIQILLIRVSLSR